MERRRLLIDLAAVLWAVLWILLAVQIAVEVRGLRDLSATVSKTGAAVEEAGRALERLDRVPIVGAEIAPPAERIQQAGQSAIASGRSSRENVEDLSLLLAIAIGVPPIVAVLGVYLNLRDRLRPVHHERRARRRARQGAG